jgi:hypothetical protein
VLIEVFQPKIIADSNVSTRNPDLHTMVTSLRKYFLDKKDDSGITIVTHANLIRHLGNTGSHAGNYTPTEFDSVAAISSTARVIQYTIQVYKRNRAGGGIKSPAEVVAAPPQNQFPPLATAGPSPAASRHNVPNQAYPANGMSNAMAAAQLQAMLQPGVQSPPMQHPGWFPPVGVGMPQMVAAPYYAQSPAVPVAKQPAAAPASSAAARLASSPPQQPVAQLSTSPPSLVVRSEAHSVFPSAVRNAANMPKAPMGGSFSALSADGRAQDDDADDAEYLLAPDENKPKPKVPAGKAARRQGPVGAENRPAGAPLKPKAGARLPQGPPREPGAPAPPPRPGRRRNRKGKWKATEAGLAAMQAQQQPQAKAEDDEQDDEEVDPNIELLDEELLLTADEPDSNFMALCGLDKSLDPNTVFMKVMEITDAMEYRAEVVNEKLVMFISFPDAEQAGKCYEKFQWESFGGEGAASCWYVRCFPERLE